MTANGKIDATVLTAANLAAMPALAHGFSTRMGGVSKVYGRDGDLNLGYTAEDHPSNVRENRARLQHAVGADQFRAFALLCQRHTPTLHRVRSADSAALSFAEPGRLEGDALATDVPGILLTIQTADCIPVLVFDPKRRAVAAFHAGWRGTVCRIVEDGVTEMHTMFRSDPAKVLAAIGPGIGPDSYEVGEEVRRSFDRDFEYADELFRPSSNNGHFLLDLWEANRRQLMAAGVPAENITLLGQDTAADTEQFFSYRSERGRTGRMMSVIGLKDA